MEQNRKNEPNGRCTSSAEKQRVLRQFMRGGNVPAVLKAAAWGRSISF